MVSIINHQGHLENFRGCEDQDSVLFEIEDNALDAKPLEIAPTKFSPTQIDGNNSHRGAVQTH
jgi:hypothetical protein